MTGFAAYLLLRAWKEARHKADLQLLVAERTGELETANKELEAFSYSVSHDLRAPLRSIDGFSRILLDDCKDRLDAKHGNYLERIRAATQRMGELIDDLLKLSRVTRAGMSREVVDLGALAAAVVEDLRRADPQRRIAIDIQPGLTAVGDVPLLRVLLENLIGNAWKFTGKTPDARIAFGARDDASNPRVYFVRDNGAGFDMNYANKRFSGSTAWTSSPEPGSASPPCSASCTATADGFGRKARSARAPLFTLRFNADGALIKDFLTAETDRSTAS